MLCATPPTWAPSDVTKLAACVPWKPEAEQRLTLDIYHPRLFFPQIASQPFTPNLFILFC